METSFGRKELLKKVLQNKDIKKLITTEDISMEKVDQNLNSLLAYDMKINKCAGCKGLDGCKQASVGYCPSLSYNSIRFEIDYVPCKYLQQELELQKKASNLELISCNFTTFNFDNVYVNKQRQSVLIKIKECMNNYENGVETKGLFIHGQYGCGKTYLLAYLAKNLAEAGHKVLFAYYPDLVRMMKSSISTGELENLIEKLKSVEVLVFDDFGGELLTSFIRDEVLGAVLQDRMSNNRLTFMSSNLDEKLLFDHLKESKSDIDDLRASRIYERIRALMEFVKLEDNNYRR